MLKIETECHKKVERSGQICLLCVGRITNPDVPVDGFHSADDEDAPDPMCIEDELHHGPSLYNVCSGCATTRQMFSDLCPIRVFTVS